MAFDLLASSGAARRGRLRTAHGSLETPAFVAVGTQATVKAVPPASAARAGTQVLFANTYHLYLRPGEEVVAKHGGLHRFMNWQRPIMTDSGGFQIFSLGASIEHGVGKVANIFPGEDRAQTSGLRSTAREGEGMVEVEDERVVFTSHIDGSTHVFTPETSIDIQRALGADIVLAFDECTSPLHDLDYTRASAERTHRWAQRCLDRFAATPARHGYPQALYGIVQGGAFEELRKHSADVIGSMDFEGFAVGGNLGSTHEDMHRVLEWTTPRLPPERPRHLLGIGDVPGIFASVARGIDTFDCVAPTRNARNGGALVRWDFAGAGDDPSDRHPVANFRLNLRNARFADDPRPIEPGCDCEACTAYSRAYVRHLLKANEQLGPYLVSVHNLRFMARLMAEIRDAIEGDRFAATMRDWLAPTAAEPGS